MKKLLRVAFGLLLCSKSITAFISKAKRISSSRLYAAASQLDEGKSLREHCNVVFTHTNADFDSFAAAVALSMLWSKEQPDLPTHVVLPRGVNPVLQRFLAYHKHLLPVRGFKTIQPEDVNSIGVVDAQSAARIGRGRAWLKEARSIHIYDHHEGNPDAIGDDSSTQSLLDIATEAVIEKVGSTTTLLVEKLKEANIRPQPHEATLFFLGIRADTGGLVYEGTTTRDAAALLWCLENGASQAAISEFAASKIGEIQRSILQTALRNVHSEIINGLRVSSVIVEHDQYVAGLAQVCEEVLELTDSDVFLLCATHRSSKNNKNKEGTKWVSLIGRASARALGVDLNAVMRRFEGGGHPKAAAASVRCCGPENDDELESPRMEGEDTVGLANRGLLTATKVREAVLSLVRDQIPEQLVASSFMVPVSHVFCVNTDMTVAQAKEFFETHNLKSAPVVELQTYRFRSSLKLNDIIKASRAGRSEDKIKGMIRPSQKTVLPDTDLAELEHILVHEGIGRIPVVDDDGALVGMVTRTDVLRQHNFYRDSREPIPELLVPLRGPAPTQKNTTVAAMAEALKENQHLLVIEDDL